MKLSDVAGREKGVDMVVATATGGERSVPSPCPEEDERVT